MLVLLKRAEWCVAYFLCWSMPPSSRLEDITIAGFYFSILEGPFNEEALHHRRPLL